MPRSVASRLEALAAGGPAPRDHAGAVHSVFPHAVNLTMADGRLLAVHAPGPLRAPFALALDRWPLPGPVMPGDPVALEHGNLRIGANSVGLGTAALVSLQPGQPPGSPAGGVMYTAHTAERVAQGLTLEPWPPTAQALRTPHADAIARRLADGVARGDAAAFTEAATALVGFGEGLTPAGDDVVVGALAAVHAMGHPLAADRDVAERLSHAARTRTTDVGREFLLHALDGEFAECVLDAVSADRDRARRGVTALLAHGASSGADTLCGVRLAALAMLGVAG